MRAGRCRDRSWSSWWCRCRFLCPRVCRWAWECRCLASCDSRTVSGLPSSGPDARRAPADVLSRERDRATQGETMQIPTSGVHHITLIGSNRQDTIDFYQGVLGMPLILEQPNLDVPEETHLYFDAGDGRLITFFVREDRATDPTPTPEAVGAVHHIAYIVSPEVQHRAAEG